METKEKIHVCRCGFTVRTACQEYICPKCNRHIIHDMTPPKHKCDCGKRESIFDK